MVNNKVILVTGASKGIGRATAVKLAASGARVALMARSRDDLQKVQAEIVKKGGICEVFAGDVSDEKYVNKTVATVIDKWGGLEIVINNAGFGIFKPADEISAEEWDAVFATNVKGTFLVSKAVIPHMKSKHSGHIINIASDVAKRTFANGSLYCASKYAQDAFSMALRKELLPFKIKVSVVYSGLVDSYFHAEPQGDSSHKDWLQIEDMANAISFIASQPAHVVIDELMIHPVSQQY